MPAAIQLFKTEVLRLFIYGIQCGVHMSITVARKDSV